MGKRQNPRYITIRIQYYPIPGKFLITSLLVCLFLFFLPTIGMWINSLQIVPKKAIAHLSIPGYTSLLVQFVSPTVVSEDTVPVEKEGQVIFHGSRDRKEIALTFDADMTGEMKKMLEKKEVESYYDNHLIDILKETQTKATLFLTGLWIETYPEITKELAKNQLFELGSHSFSHPSFDGTCFGLRQISDDEDEEEINKTQTLLQQIAGVTGKIFRFPGGCYSKNDLAIVERNRLQAIQWDVAGIDGFNNNAQAIEEMVVNHVQNGSIIVLHMNGYPNEPKTAESLINIITKLKEKGFIFVTVSELLSSKQITQNIYPMELLTLASK